MKNIGNSTWTIAIIVEPTGTSFSVLTGKVRYWFIVVIPLTLFLVPIIANELGIVNRMFLEYGNQFSIVYYALFSPYQQLGGLLFGMTFWVTARRVKRRNLKTLLSISGIGILLLFGSSVIHGLNYVVFPPFGIVTISFLGLASYLLLVGIYSSAKELAKDTVIRREIYRVAEKEFSLLREIGMGELDKTILNKVEPMIARLEPSWEAWETEKAMYMVLRNNMKLLELSLMSALKAF